MDNPQIEIPVRITDINYGQHLGNDRLFALMHEARCQFLQQHGYSEKNVAGAGLIMREAQAHFKAEVLYGQTLVFDIHLTLAGKVGFDMHYNIWRKEDQKTVAQARTSMVFFDYQTKRPLRTPQAFMNRFASPQKPQE